MTVKIEPRLGDANALAQRTFHFCCFGNFSGAVAEREDWRPRELSRNNWDRLFEDLQPSATVDIALPKVDDLRLSLKFRSLRDFREKGLIAQVPLLSAMAELARALGAASKEKPFDAAEFLGQDALAPLRQLIESHGQNQTVDLLSMVDLGEEEEDEGLSLPTLKSCLMQNRFEGADRGKAVAELNQVQRLILDQIEKDPAFQDLHGRWRGLRVFLPHIGPEIRVSLIDCLKSELCDAAFLTFVKPENGAPPPLDCAFFCEELGLGDDDRHILHHLGRMAERLTTPFILNAAPEVFGCKTWRHLSHVRDITGRLTAPTHVKWRKLREEESAHWLFLAVNPFLAKEGDEPEEDGAASPTAPASYYLALLLIYHLHQGDWPSELTGPLGRLSAASACLAQLGEEQGGELAYEGFCAITGVDGGDTLRLLGMSGFGHIKIPAHMQLQPGNLVEFTLPYRFYSGCCSRFLHRCADDPEAGAKLRAFADAPNDSDFQYEEAEGQKIYRVKAPFTVFGVRPDIILAVE